MELKFVIPGEPKGKGRPRFGRSGHAYTPHDTATYENLVKTCFKDQYPDHIPVAPGIPIKCYILAYFGIPKSTSKRKRMQMAIDLIRPLKKPDADNIIKIVCDALNGIAYYDDAQIVEVILEKMYDDTPRVFCRLEYEDGE